MNDSRSGFGSLHMPRSRGAVSGLLLIILGVWGAVIPFIGPYFHFAYTPDQAWAWSTARGWLEVFPGITTAIGGFLLLISGNRATAMFGGWLAVIGGAWFVVGRTLTPLLRIGDIGHPIAWTDAKRAVLEIAYFSGLGALIVFLGGAVLARVSVRTARDLEYALEAEEAADASGAFAAPAAPIEVLSSAEPQRHRRESKGGFFCRGRASVAGN
ncbi:MAG TPA: hypothetical protein VKI00_04445 [Mycobacterium sp.]|uniref:hypothetical protein n=1 Tax=Mycobacterium sp. TaxID=1785 RepID=UPI002D183E31|nr:hypothetical protein [Mycobacterium sp.]HME74915.1 hypothetical protein [Mycobacterium sp.]